MASISQENAALVRRFLMDVGACGDTNAVTDLFAAGSRDHHFVIEGAERQEVLTGLGWHALASGDVDLHIEDGIASDDRVAVHGQATGTHQKSLMDPAPTGRAVDLDCAWCCRIEAGRIAWVWPLPGGLGLFKQLDAVSEESSNAITTSPIPRKATMTCTTIHRPHASEPKQRTESDDTIPGGCRRC